MNQQIWEQALLSLLLWREARGEDTETKRAVAWTVRNRATHPSWWGSTWWGVMAKPEQYSSMTIHGDPNTVAWPTATDTAWAACMDIASEVYVGGGVDCAKGATNYFDKSLDANPPVWAAKMVHVMDLGNFHFYR